MKATPVKLAPADEYFGPLKMSVLGIRNEIHDLGIRYDVKADGDHALAKRIMGTALLTEASLADWEKKYPSDDQLARDVYLLQHLYAKIASADAQTKARYCALWLVGRYPNTWYAKNMRVSMGKYLKAPPPTPAPTAAPSATPEATAAPSASPPPSSGPSTAPHAGEGTPATEPLRFPLPDPLASPSASPAPTPIVTPAATPAATPVASPTATPVASPIPSPMPSPIAIPARAPLHTASP